VTGRRRALLLAGTGIALAAAIGSVALRGGGLSSRRIPACRVQRGSFIRRTSAEGYLRAVKSIPINVPPEVPVGQHIAWLAPDGSLVKKGDVVARIDTGPLEGDLADGRGELEKTKLRTSDAEESGEKERENLALDAALAEREAEQEEQFAPRDPVTYSRREIVDSEIDRELTQDRIANTRQKSDVALRRSRNQEELLRIDRDVAEWKLRKAQRGLSGAEIRAPHDGLLVVARDWEGNVLGPGLQAWPGQRLGEIPDPGDLEAVAYVLEADATGLKPGCRATLTVEAHPEKSYPATVQKADPLAKRRQWNVPIQYFEITLSLDGKFPEEMKPGLRVLAEIVLQERASVLMVPPEAVFPEEGGEVAFRKTGGRFVAVPVQVGDRSLSRVVVAGGLKEGDEVALQDPRSASRKTHAGRPAAGPPAPASSSVPRGGP
jgi:HlyD family secretion protein